MCGDGRQNYRKIRDLGDKVWWLCEACVRKIENMKSYVCDTFEYINLHDLVGSLFKIVKDLSNDNVLIKKKIDEVSLLNKELANCIYSMKPEMVQKPEHFMSSATDFQDADFKENGIRVVADSEGRSKQSTFSSPLQPDPSAHTNGDAENRSTTPAVF